MDHLDQLTEEDWRAIELEILGDALEENLEFFEEELEQHNYQQELTYSCSHCPFESSFFYLVCFHMALDKQCSQRVEATGWGYPVNRAYQENEEYYLALERKVVKDLLLISAHLKDFFADKALRWRCPFCDYRSRSRVLVKWHLLLDRECKQLKDLLTDSYPVDKKFLEEK